MAEYQNRSRSRAARSTGSMPYSRTRSVSKRRFFSSAASLRQVTPAERVEPFELRDPSTDGDMQEAPKVPRHEPGIACRREKFSDPIHSVTPRLGCRAFEFRLWGSHPRRACHHA